MTPHRGGTCPNALGPQSKGIEGGQAPCYDVLYVYYC